MSPTSTPWWLQLKLSYRASSSAATCISFFLLSISLFSPSWMEVITPETKDPAGPTEATCTQPICIRANKDSEFTKAARILLVLATATGFFAAFSLFVSCRCIRPNGRISNMLVSAVASFTTGTCGYASMALYTVDISWREMTTIGHLHFTWSFCLAWLVFSLYFMNGFFSLVTHILYPVTAVGWHGNQIFIEEQEQELASGDNMAVGSLVLPRQGNPTNPGSNAFLVPSICMSSTLL
ncbi:uncharacterized protein LOC143838925 isoform X2 [Paroedura picta]|uniref:uncharacterized protein LOC143838925 isoform X2 n=1 Tax=Paroedura picta TaxID=143630 RepID=UPI0040575C0F